MVICFNWGVAINPVNISWSPKEHICHSSVLRSRSSPFRTPEYNTFWYRFIDWKRHDFSLLRKREKLLNKIQLLAANFFMSGFTIYSFPWDLFLFHGQLSKSVSVCQKRSLPQFYISHLNKDTRKSCWERRLEMLAIMTKQLVVFLYSPHSTADPIETSEDCPKWLNPSTWCYYYWRATYLRILI